MRKGSPPMGVVDASVWVSRLVPQDKHHAASRLWLETFLAQEGRVAAPALLLPEIAGAISRRTGKPKLAHVAVGQLQRLTALRLVRLDRRLAESAARLAGDLSLRGADAVYVAIAHQLKIPLLTWDEEQHTRASPLIVVATPETA
jgi:predicted nucleic acid-binding protein